MSNYSNFLSLYIKYSNELLFGKNSIRPAKSITRNIISGVEPFVRFYNSNKRLVYSDSVVSSSILNLGTSDVTSTTRDNIRNMEELNFMIYSDNTCRLTRNFLDFIRSGISLKEYILNQLKSISSLSDITMFYNCLLCVLREGVIYGEIINYPDSLAKFSSKVQRLSDRKELCEKVYKLYGFHGLNDLEFGYYTPNANYRIVSTCVSLGLIKRSGTNYLGFTRFTITSNGFALLSALDKNIFEFNKSVEAVEQIEINQPSKSDNKEANLYEDIYDRIYLAEANQVEPDTIVDYVDVPQALPNTLNTNVYIKRDPKKAANAKKRANYQCEFDSSHKTFIGSNGENFCEAHHLIPMFMQYKFFYSLDVEANIVSLCPNCHSTLHHSNGEEKIKIITKLYNERIERLRKCNIYISLEDLIEIYCK